MTKDIIVTKKGIEDERRTLDIQELSNMNRVDLEQRCIYLMKKRIALEDGIARLYRDIATLNERNAKLEQEIDTLRHKLVVQGKIATETIQRLNKEKIQIGEELVSIQTELEQCHSQ